MITPDTIRELISEKLINEDKYIVDIKVKPGNKIIVLIDSIKGNISISDCVQISRQIEANLDREKEDFELNVSSAGIDQPFKVLKQYIKNVGKQIEITTIENKKLTGTLCSANEETVELETKSKEKIEGQKQKQLITKKHKLNYNQIKETKIVISF
jgi:ribosome maturation factor RimP